MKSCWEPSHERGRTVISSYRLELWSFICAIHYIKTALSWSIWS